MQRTALIVENACDNRIAATRMIDAGQISIDTQKIVLLGFDRDLFAGSIVLDLETHALICRTAPKSLDECASGEGEFTEASLHGSTALTPLCAAFPTKCSGSIGKSVDKHNSTILVVTEIRNDSARMR